MVKDSMRFIVNYRIFTDSEADARKRAEGIALEQTVEIPRDVVPAGYIEDEILGKVDAIEPEGPGRFTASISYSPDSVGTELPQLLNVIFGNSSLQQDIKVTGLTLGPVLEKRFPGAKFGIAGLRKLANRPTGGLISPVIKPQGSDARTLAEIAYRCALAGADIIKEDHGLTNQPMAPFKQRCEAIANAVAKANRETGGSSLYFPNIAGETRDLMDFARFAKQAGADGFLVMPGLFGFGLMQQLANDPDLGLPLMSHPSFLGPYVLPERNGFTHGMMFGVLQRLSGADIAVFPNVGGRFGFSHAECREIASHCVDPHGIGASILPSPGGGMSPDRAAEMKSMYGDDAVYLLGGSLLRYGERIGDGIRAMRRALAVEAVD